MIKVIAEFRNGEIDRHSSVIYCPCISYALFISQGLKCANKDLLLPARYFIFLQREKYYSIDKERTIAITFICTNYKFDENSLSCAGKRNLFPLEEYYKIFSKK